MPLAPATPWTMEQVRQFIDGHLDEAFDAGALAAHAGLSPSHMVRQFRRAFHETPHKYVTRRRLERAGALLVEDGLPVTEVCFAVGFESLGSFSTLFRAYWGEPPTSFRMRRLTAQRRGIPGCFATMCGPAEIPAR